MGIDTIRVGGRTVVTKIHHLENSRHARTLDHSTGVVQDRAESGFTDLGDTGLKLQVGTVAGEAHWHLEFSVPRLLRTDNATPAAPADVRASLEGLRPRVEAHLGDVGPATTWHVTRLDIVRDFHGVVGVSPLLEGLGRVAVPHAKTNEQYRSPDGRRVQTLRKGTPGRYMSTLYDKHAEMLFRGHDAARTRPGHLRYEVSLRRPVLREERQFTVGDLTIEGITTLAGRFFTRCGYHKEVRGMDRARMEIHLQYDTLTASERKRLTKMLGILHMQAAGLDPNLSGTTLKAHLDLARKLGLSVADFVAPGQHSLRLDFASGTQEVLGWDC